MKRAQSHRRASPNPPDDAFVGRQEALDELCGALDRGMRLVSIVGPGGIGKTRLAQELAASLVARGQVQSGGIRFCDLSHARSQEDLLEAVAMVTSIELRADADEALSQRLGQLLDKHNELLLILDNFEQLVELAPQTVGQWLEIAPRFQTVVTTREALGLAGEQRLELGPLSPEDSRSLFTERARRTKPGYGSGDADDLASLVSELEGVPLAIELAAARVSLFSPAELLARVSRSFDVLKGRRRDRGDRQTSVRATMDWSWQLLKPPERIALAQCSFFCGGFDLAAAEAVLDLSAHPEASCLDILEALIHKSLLRAEANDLGHRFSMYTVIREYAAERLAELSTSEGLEERHRRYYAELGERSAAQVLGAEGPDHFAVLTRERDNIVAAFRGGICDDPTTAIRALLSLVPNPLLLVGESMVFHLASLERAEALAKSGAISGELRAGLALALGAIRIWLDHLPEARGRLRTAVELAQKHSTPTVELKAVAAAAMVERLDGNAVAAIPLFERALSLARQLGDTLFEGLVLTFYGGVCWEIGRTQQATKHHDHASDLLSSEASPLLSTILYVNRGTQLLSELRLEEAQRLFAKSLAINRGLDADPWDAIALSGSGAIAWLEGDPDEACDLLAEAVASLSKMGNRRDLLFALWLEAAAEASAGRPAVARITLAETSQLAAEDNDPSIRTSVILLEGLVDIALARHAAERDELAPALALMSSGKERIAVGLATVGGAWSTSPYLRIGAQGIQLETAAAEAALAELQRRA